MELASGESKRVLSGGFYSRYVPTGHLLFVRDTTIFAIRFDRDALEVSGSAAPVLEGLNTSGLQGGAQYSVAADGTLVFVTGSTGITTYPVVWVDRDGRTTSLWSEPGAYGAPRISPDGQRLSLTVYRDNNFDVWIYDLAREVPTRLTFEDGYDADQLFTPDGEHIIFTSDRGGGQDLYILRADGSGAAELLARSDNNIWPSSITSDGRWLIVEMMNSSIGGFDIMVVDLEAPGELQPFLATEFNERFSAISANDRWIAYQSDESGRNEIYVRPFPAATGKWQVSAGGGFWPRWSPDGRELYYSVDEGLMVVPILGSGESFRAGKAEPLIVGSYRGNGPGISIGGSFVFHSYDVAPDGRFIMFPGEEQDSGRVEATIVFNWLEELKLTLAGR